MKVTTILGSPKKNGNTAKVLGLFEEQIAQDHNVDRITVATSSIKGCLGCHACQKVPDEPGCVQKDDALPIFERMMSSDVVIYASPLYCWGFSSQMKALLDRHFCLVTGYGTPDYKSLVQDKNVALLVTCAGPVENNTDLIQTMFDRMSDWGQCNVIGKYVVPFCTTPDAIGAEGMEIVKKMAADIAAAQCQ
ncbi:MAG: flavodoxin family protein [Phycisphaerales bacterium]|nr:MAG: flavodoxin family protein [Phycisphaerales bacterium]